MPSAMDITPLPFFRADGWLSSNNKSTDVAKQPDSALIGSLMYKPGGNVTSGLLGSVDLKKNTVFKY